MKRNGSCGFSLMELLIAVGLSVVVLMAVFGMMTSMFRFQVEGLKKSTVTGWSVASLSKMTKEIESGSVLVYPTDATPRDWLVGCANWSRILTTGKADPNQNVVVFYYCYDSASQTIRRLAWDAPGATCPTSPVTLPTCDETWGGANKSNDVVAAGVNHLTSGVLMFTKDDGVGGVRIRFAVGEQTPTHVAGKPDIANPQYLEFDTTASMSRSYLNTND